MESDFRPFGSVVSRQCLERPVTHCPCCDLLLQHDRRLEHVIADHIQRVIDALAAIDLRCKERERIVPPSRSPSFDVKPFIAPIDTPVRPTDPVVDTEPEPAKKVENRRRAAKTTVAGNLRNSALEGTRFAHSPTTITTGTTGSTRRKTRFERLRALDRTENLFAQSNPQIKPQPVNGRAHSLLSRIVGNNRFEFLSGFAVILNSLVVGLQVDASIRPSVYGDVDYLERIEYGFTILFTCELLLRFLVSGCNFLRRKNPEFLWNVFDTSLVAINLVDVMLSYITSSLDVSYARVVRMFRFVRLLRTFRVLRFFKDLRVMVLSIANSFMTLTWAFCFIFLVIYVVSVLLLQIIDMQIDVARGDTPPESFVSLQSTAYVLFGSMNGGTDWMEACDQLFSVSLTLGFSFLVYIAFMTFCIMNVITAIFLDNALRFSSQDEEILRIAETDMRIKWVAEVKRVFELADEDGSGLLDFDEFDQALKNLEVQILLKKLGIEALASSSKAMFDLFDFDGTGFIDLDAFADGLMKFCGTAKSIDMAQMTLKTHHLQREVRGVANMVRQTFNADGDEGEAEPGAFLNGSAKAGDGTHSSDVGDESTTWAVNGAGARKVQDDFAKHDAVSAFTNLEFDEDLLRRCANNFYISEV
eukprot:TRINITY_DN26656_c0_g7_i1.p1 TRINITY_DN26656_c0_g7~~TRINITY_DN26656_c0_g7_i1.p1  ORF type:complete len:643 (+),score=84.22 TRINITY_DN26656_c0_g7_i1:50-1978(+)